jgi:hypothetical protein
MLPPRVPVLASAENVYTSENLYSKLLDKSENENRECDATTAIALIIFCFYNYFTIIVHIFHNIYVYVFKDDFSILICILFYS